MLAGFFAKQWCASGNSAIILSKHGMVVLTGKVRYNMNQKRKLHFDLLRMAAAFSVVLLHSASQYWYTQDVYSREWLVTNFYDAVSRFGVPVFVMISGAMFLDKSYQLNIRRLYGRNILRLVLLYIVWSCVYGITDFVNFGWTLERQGALFREMLYGRYHLWFLPMMVGIYMLLPILKTWTEHVRKREIEYFLLLFLVLQICSETLKVFKISDEVLYVLDLGKVEMACSYVGYFVLGYYLAHVGIGPKLRKALYLAVVPSLLANVVLSVWLVRRHGVYSEMIFDSYGLFTFVVACALFVFAVDRGSKLSFGAKGSRLIRELSSDTLGVYVMHLWLMEFLEPRGIHSMTLPGIIGVPLFALFCYVVCTVAAGILRRIPVIGRYLA